MSKAKKIACSGYVYCRCPYCTADISERVHDDLKEIYNAASLDGKGVEVYRLLTDLFERIDHAKLPRAEYEESMRKYRAKPQ